MSSLPGIYLISDRKLLPDGMLVPAIEKLLDAGLEMLQLREKDLSAAKLFPLAEQLRTLTAPYNCKLLINDRIDLALAVGADGVHLGSHSLPTAAARKLLGKQKLIGVSTHSVNEVAQAAAEGADFVTFGPIFPTPSKAAYGEPLGLSQLALACQASRIPLFALGGIKLQHAQQALACGAAGVAMISALLSADNPAAAFENLQTRLAAN